jgi:hypothetical protein
MVPLIIVLVSNFPVLRAFFNRIPNTVGCRDVALQKATLNDNPAYERANTRQLILAVKPKSAYEIVLQEHRNNRASDRSTQSRGSKAS